MHGTRIKLFNDRLKKTINFISVVLGFVAGGFLISLAFAVIYKDKGLSDVVSMADCFGFSLNTFWGLGFSDGSLAKYSNVIYIFEKLLGIIYELTFSGLLVAVFLKKVNPIHISDYIVYNSDIQRFEVRYFLKTHRHEHLYDVKVQVSEVTTKNANDGRNKVKSDYPDFGYQEEYSLARSVRFISLEKENGICEIRKFWGKEAPEKHRYHIRVIISGVDESGNRFSKLHWYHYGDFYNGYKFVSVRLSEFDTNLSKKLGMNVLFMNHFDKIEKCEAAGLPCIEQHEISPKNLIVRKNEGIDYPLPDRVHIAYLAFKSKYRLQQKMKK